MNKFIILSGIFLISLLLLVGCSKKQQEDIVMQKLPTNTLGITEKLYNYSICGGLSIKKPYFNIEGFVTGNPRENITIYLFLAPRTDLESALEIVERCRYVGRQQLNRTGGFRFGPLPVGSYILRLSAYQFDEVLGFPIINEYNESNHSVEMIFHGGDYRHSLSAFSIIPRKNEK